MPLRITHSILTATPPPSGDIPLTYNDARFSGNTNSNAITQSGGTISFKSITDSGAIASIVNSGGTTIIDTCRVNSREAVRVTSGVDIRNSYLETLGQGDDHADTIQAYSPGETGAVIICTNTAIVAHTVAATAGLFIADDWSGTLTLNNVCFIGGPYGLRVHSDPGCTVNLDLLDVFFVGPFGAGATLISEIGNGVINVNRWTNVRNATIVDGVIVPGSSISSP